MIRVNLLPQKRGARGAAPQQSQRWLLVVAGVAPRFADALRAQAPNLVLVDAKQLDLERADGLSRDR